MRRKYVKLPPLVESLAHDRREAVYRDDKYLGEVHKRTHYNTWDAKVFSSGTLMLRSGFSRKSSAADWLERQHG